MKQDVEYKKRELLLEAAKQEFLDKGYNKASLRNICAKAGVTTGALYFFFDNKAELFAAIVDRPVNGLKEILMEHVREDSKYMASLESVENIEMDHSEISDMLIEHIYRYYDSFMLLLSSAENTAYENCVDDFVEMTQRSIPLMLSALDGYTYDEYNAHWMSHITVDAIIHVIKHEKDKEIAKKRMRSIMNYLIQGWVGLVMVKED